MNTITHHVKLRKKNQNAFTLCASTLTFFWIMVGTQNVKETNCPGPKIIGPPKVTTKRIAAFIEALHNVFGEGYLFVPEPITEGGIVMKTCPTINEMGIVSQSLPYKSLRMYLRNWPHLAKDGSEIVQDWLNANETEEIVLCDANYSTHLRQPIRHARACEISTFLKTRNGAPEWTVAELVLVNEALQEAGMKFNRIPRRIRTQRVSNNYAR